MIAKRLRKPARRPTQLGLALDGNYINNIDPDKMVSHLLCGSDTEYRAALMLEKAIDSIGEGQAYHYEERLQEATDRRNQDITSIEMALGAALDALDGRHITARQFIATVTAIRKRADVMATHDFSYIEASEYIADGLAK